MTKTTKKDLDNYAANLKEMAHLGECRGYLNALSDVMTFVSTNVNYPFLGSPNMNASALLAVLENLQSKNKEKINETGGTANDQRTI